MPPRLLWAIFVHRSLRLHTVLFTTTLIFPTDHHVSDSAHPSIIYIYSLNNIHMTLHIWQVQIFPPCIQHHSQAANLLLKGECDSLFQPAFDVIINEQVLILILTELLMTDFIQLITDLDTGSGHLLPHLIWLKKRNSDSISVQNYQ